MEINEEINEIRGHIRSIEKILADIGDRLDRAKDAWPDHQILPAEWHDRSVTPPAGQIWASDGIRMWLIWSDGEPISPGATSVKYWTTAYIPAPPNGKPTGYIPHLTRDEYRVVFPSDRYCWIMPNDLLRRWSEVAHCGWDNIVEVAQRALLDETEKAIKAGEIRLIGTMQA